MRKLVLLLGVLTDRAAADEPRFPDPPQYPTAGAVDPPQYPTRGPNATPDVRPLPREVPPGYPPAPTGYRWERYPAGQWGLVQDGVVLSVVGPTPARVTTTTRPYVTAGECRT